MPRTVRVATWLILGSVVYSKVLLAIGQVLVNAAHAPSSGDSPLLAVMAGGLMLTYAIPTLLIAVFFFFMLRQRRNWARWLFALVAVAAFYPVLVAFRVVNFMYQGAWGLAPSAYFFRDVLAAPLLLLFAAGLLFVRASNVWFRSIEPTAP